MRICNNNNNGIKHMKIGGWQQLAMIRKKYHVADTVVPTLAPTAHPTARVDCRYHSCNVCQAARDDCCGITDWWECMRCDARHKCKHTWSPTPSPTTLSPTHAPSFAPYKPKKLSKSTQTFLLELAGKGKPTEEEDFQTRYLTSPAKSRGKP